MVGPRSDGVPQQLSVEAGATQPYFVAATRGPGHDHLQALAEGRGAALTLAGRYRLDRCIGRGGMATVFAGELTTLGRQVAVKILDDGRGDHDDGLGRFLHEARTMAQLRHPNIVEVSDLGSTAEGVVYMVMELLEGEDLHALLEREGRLPWAEVRSLMTEVCAGLTVIHEAGIVHRDIKPANCFRTTTGLKLLDFGIAIAHGPASKGAPGARDRRRLTVDGHVIGTPEYMSPEQARGATLDGRSDVYAAGILLGELLTGRVPFEDESAASIIDAQIHRAPPTLRALAGDRIALHPELEVIYAKALSKDPADRFASAAQLRAAIAAVDPETQPRSCYGPLQALAASALLTATLPILATLG